MQATYLDTIRPRPEPGNAKLPEIGQRIKLSAGDIAQTNLLYKCPSKLLLTSSYNIQIKLLHETQYFSQYRSNLQACSNLEHVIVDSHALK